MALVEQPPKSPAGQLKVSEVSVPTVAVPVSTVEETNAPLIEVSGVSRSTSSVVTPTTPADRLIGVAPAALSWMPE